MPEPSRQSLVSCAFDLVAKATPDRPHPVSVIELPTAGRVVVAELLDLERPWKDADQPSLTYRFAQQMAMSRAQRILADYFRFDAVKHRLGYRTPDEKQV